MGRFPTGKEKPTSDRLNKTVRLSAEEVRAMASRPLREAREVFERLARWRNESRTSPIRL